MLTFHFPDDHQHDHGYQQHDHHPNRIGRRSLLKAGGIGLGGILLGACGSTTTSIASKTTVPAAPATSNAPVATIAETTTAALPASTLARTSVAQATATTSASSPSLLAGFDAFAESVKVLAEGDYWLVESNGMPAHNLMVGITNWQQQVPVPQPYTGSNAWKIPRRPVLADAPISAKSGLFRGAIALAVNGVPIFNALNNRGEDSFLIGELDQWGGHCGRADDYHYHVAPLHLQSAVGPSRPIAYALDGFALYGETEPDGSPVGPLDQLNGHTDASGVYHYHGTKVYPYINGGMRGKVTVKDEQIDPQAATKPFRPAGAPLRGAAITGFASPTKNSYELDFTVSGAPAHIAYQISGSSVVFTFTDASGLSRTETYAR